MRVVFMGTPDFAVPTLRALLDAGHEVPCAYTQPPRPAGRGQRDRPSPVQAEAEAHGIEVRYPLSLRRADEQAAFAALETDVAVVVAYGLLLPKPVLDAPARGCLNLHASLLPRWRGAAPIHRAVMAGDRETGACVMRMEAGLDTGPVLLREALPIGPEGTTGDLHDHLATRGARLMTEALARLDALRPVPQPEDGITYARKVDKAEARINWTRPATEVDRLVRGLSPHPGAWFETLGASGGERVRALRSRLVEGAGAPGEALHGLTVACGEGAVELLEVQRAGARAMAGDDVLRGWTPPSRLA